MATSMNDLFGKQLYLARQARGESLAHVCNNLVIREFVLNALELSDFASLPHKGFARNHLSSYARYLGLDTTQLTEQFLREYRLWEEGKLIIENGDSDVMQEDESSDSSHYRKRQRVKRALVSASSLSLWREDDTLAEDAAQQDNAEDNKSGSGLSLLGLVPKIEKRHIALAVAIIVGLIIVLICIFTLVLV